MLTWPCMLYILEHIYGLAQDSSNSIANTLELLQSWTKPSKYFQQVDTYWNQFCSWSLLFQSHGWGHSSETESSPWLAGGGLVLVLKEHVWDLV